MHPKTLLLPSLLIVAFVGCASPTRERDAAVRAAERVRAESAQSRYWALQAEQKPKPVTDRFELLPLRLPERTEDGVIRTPSVEFIRIPLTP